MGEVKRGRDVSSAITFEFEQFASRVCDLGKVDLANRPSEIRNLVIGLSERFRKFAGRGNITDDEAARLAFDSFGRAEDMAKTMRDGLSGLWHRLMYHEGYRLHRLGASAAVCLLHHWIRMSSSVQYTVTALGEESLRFVTPNWNYYIGLFFVAAIFLPVGLPLLFRVPKRIAQVAAIGFLSFFFATLSVEWWNSVGEIYSAWTTGGWHRPDIKGVPMWKNAAVGMIWAGLFCVEAMALLAAAPLAVAEILDFPNWKKERTLAEVEKRLEYGQ